MKISFLLPSVGRYPLGGFRIVYEHANRLAAGGHDVAVMHVAAALPNEQTKRERFKNWARYAVYGASGKYRPDEWFSLHPNIRLPWHFSFEERHIPDGDVVIATAWQTADFVAGLSSIKGKKFYFIQHFEDWACPKERLLGTWRLPLEKIVVAHWLKDIAQREGGTATFVPNAVDYDFFNIRTPLEERSPKSILLQSHSKDWKGTSDVIAAITALFDAGESPDVTIFSQHERDLTQVKWPFRYVAKPTQSMLRTLYNETAIFVAPSWSEGWGLTAHEAAACGAAVVATDVGGHREFLNPSCALLSPPRDRQALATNIQTLLHDNQRRIAIAKAGSEAVRKFDWPTSSRMFRDALGLPATEA